MKEKNLRKNWKRLLSMLVVVLILPSLMGTALAIEPKVIQDWEWSASAAGEDLCWNAETERWELAITLSEGETLEKEAILALLPQSIEAVLDGMTEEVVPPKEEIVPPTEEVVPPTEEVVPPTEEQLAEPSENEAEPSEPTKEAVQDAAEAAFLAAGEPIEEEPAMPQSIRLELTWQAEALDGLQGLLEGSPVTMRAVLPEDYVLGEDVPPLEITLLTAPATLLAEEGRLTDEQLKDHIVKGTDIPGTRVDLFDYWTEGQDTPDYVPNDFQKDKDITQVSKSINEGHFLKFHMQGSGKYGSYNIWTGVRWALIGEEEFYPYQGIVKPVLENKYPVICKEPSDFNDKYEYNGEWLPWYDTQNDTGGSLDYLFNPKKNVDGKKSYEDVKGLFQVDKDGYYYYNCTRNYADFHVDTNRFRLFDAPAVTHQAGEYQFFPFDSANEVFRLDEEGNLDGSKSLSRHVDRNHYFGLSMTTRFVQKNGGQTYRNQPITYEFSGDDDVWVFIDDVLVADLGGIHDAAKFTINFETGEVIINDGKKNPASSIPFEPKTTIKKQFEKANKADLEEWNGDTFADNTYHTLRFFYMERCNNDSNMSLKFNLIAIPESDLHKSDQIGNAVENAEFTLYSSEETFEEKGKAIHTGKTDKAGNLRLLDEETGGPIAFKELYKRAGTPYFILEETDIPKGYRKNSDVYLKYDPELDIVTSEKHWDTGSYAVPVVTATVPDKIKSFDGNGEWNPYENGTPDLNGTVYAVIFRYMGEKKIETKADLNGTEMDWHPIVGSPTEGWEVLKNNDIKEAIRRNTYQTSKLSSDGTYKIEIEYLPGDVKSYYYNWKKNVGSREDAGELLYTVNYYYAKGDGDFESAELHRLVPDNFYRDFSISLYVPNIKNYFVVQKTDASGNPLTGAKFALYKEEDMEAGKLTPDAKPYDTVTTKNMEQGEDKDKDPITMEGVAMFPSALMGSGKENLELGKYYLVEQEAPSGYEKNEKPIPVIVDASGVYIDAGDSEDGISTSRYVGNLLHSMKQFATNDAVDATLHDIKVQMQQTTEYPVGDNVKWSDWKDNPKDEEELHLVYKGKANAVGSVYAADKED